MPDGKGGIDPRFSPQVPTGKPNGPAHPSLPVLDQNDNQGWHYWDNLGASLFSGARQGVSMVAGAPVDLVNAAPMLANLIPGVHGVGPISNNPVGGAQSIDTLLRGGGVIPDFEPRDWTQRLASRVGMELGASAVPVGGAIARGARVGPEGLQALGPIERMFVEPAVVDGPEFVRREATNALAAGLGAGISNEAVHAPQVGNNFWSDFVGSLAGVTLANAGAGVVGMGKNLYAGATGKPKYMDNVAGQEVADRIINNSTQMADMAARTGGQIDTAGLAQDLRRRAAIEDAIPGYQANIGDRSQDPGLQTFAFNQDAVSPGAANARRVANETVVNDRMAAMEPGGDPARFRAGLQNARDQQIGAAEQNTLTHQQQLDAILQGLTPTMPRAEDRGAAVRAGVVNAEDFVRQGERAAWEGIGGQVDPGPLAAGLDQSRGGLTLARQQRISDLNQTLDIPRMLMGEADTPETADIQELISQRSVLAEERRNALSGPQPDRNRSEAIGRQIDQIDSFLGSDAVPQETRDHMEFARGVSRDVNERFNRPGDPLAETLAQREGRPVVPDSAVAKKFVQPDSGQASNIDRLLGETDLTGHARSTRAAIRDEILADVEQRGLVGKPDLLDRHLNQYGRVFERFPDLRQELTSAGASSRALQAARDTQETVTRDLTTPSRSATANYLQYGDESAAQAIRGVTTSAKPREAVKELLTTAGNTPEARRDLRSALWEEVRRRGREQAPGMTGEQRWNGKRLRDIFRDPKVAAVAGELWSDNPDELTDVKRVFDALAGAEGSTRARAAGSSGTAQSLSGKFDPSLSAASIASRARSVNRGVLSPGVAVIDILATWLRGRSAQVQSRAIDTLASSVVNNPGLAADLLEKYNPATAAARRRMITQKYGVRATQLLNLLDEAQQPDDPVRDAIGAN